MAKNYVHCMKIRKRRWKKTKEIKRIENSKKLGRSRKKKMRKIKPERV